MAKIELQSNTHTKEARPTTGTLRGGFDRRAFGFARFGETTGHEQTKEARVADTSTKEALDSVIS